MPVPKLNILIHTEFDDLHALLVSTVLKERGHQVTRSLGSDLPERSGIAFYFDRHAHSLRLHEIDTVLDLEQIDVVWNRRPQGPKLPALVAAEDREFAWTQVCVAQRSLHALSRSAFWANPTAAARAADLKPLQLQLAPAAGLDIPSTLISNEPEAIRAFLRGHPRVIYKPLHGYIWREQGREWGSYTARVQLADLPRDELLRTTPGIFQEQVDKHYEVRAQFFGDSCFALRIHSDQIQYGEYDWRLHQHADALSEAITLPEPVHLACRRLMRALGLVAGAFDFIVTPDGRWVFLEVNEAGQFLFLEMWCPQLPLIDACCAFLLARDADFRYQQPQSPVRLEQLQASAPFDHLLRQDRAMRQANVAMPGVAPATA